MTATATPKRPRKATSPAEPPTATPPIALSADAVAGTRDRAVAMQWTEDGAIVRKRPDGVYEKVHAPDVETAPEPEDYEFYPDVEMLDRRVLDPTVKTLPILFTDEAPNAPPKYYKRWVDTWIPSRVLTLEQAKYYKKAEWAMLRDKQEIGDRFEGTKTDPYVRRGEKGRYLLMFMPMTKWVAIKTAEAEKRTQRERTEMTRLAAQQGAQTKGIGAQGAEQIDSMFRGAIKELPPQSIETFQGSGLPKDIAGGDVKVLED